VVVREEFVHPGFLKHTLKERLPMIMGKVKNFVAALDRDESGQDLIEYALIAALIALGAVVGMNTVANEINSAFNIISKKLSNSLS
jgi:pilus assembly protein Flp/PilA